MSAPVPEVMALVLPGTFHIGSGSGAWGLRRGAGDTAPRGSALPSQACLALFGDPEVEVGEISLCFLWLP